MKTLSRNVLSLVRSSTLSLISQERTFVSSGSSAAFLFNNLLGTAGRSVMVRCHLMTATTSPLMLPPTPISTQQVRTRILWNQRGGHPETVQDVVDRFFRLHNGLWIRTRAGRHKKRWAKPPRRVHRLKAHVFCNRAQCQMLDKMVNKEYRLPKQYVNDPYAPYHRKSNLPFYRYQPPKFLP